MVQVLNTEEIECPSCGQKHVSQLLGFPKTVEYKGQKLEVAEFYHTCPNDKVFIQTDKDKIQTFITERVNKKQLDNVMNYQNN